MRYFAVAVQTNEELFVTTRTFETVEKPSSFANAVMTTLMDQLDAMMDTTFACVKDDLIIENFAKKHTRFGGILIK